MEDPNKGSLRGKRGRSRDDIEANLTEEERKKRQKNRDAASKCRLNKKAEVEKLKQNNATLEEENANLIQKKAHLEEMIKDLVSFIQDHMNSGCEIPETEQQWLQSNWTKIQGMVNPNLSTLNDDVVLQPEPSISPSPNAISHRSAQLMMCSPSPSLAASCSPSTSMPAVTLFTGQPISEEQFLSHTGLSYARRLSSQSSPSLSPSMSLTSSPSPQVMDSPIQPGNVYAVSAPSSAAQVAMTEGCNPFIRDQQQFETQRSTDSCASIPLVVYEETDAEEADEGLHQAQHQVPFHHRQDKDEQSITGDTQYIRYDNYNSNTFTTFSTSNVNRDGSSGVSNNLGSGGFLPRQDPNSDIPQRVPNLGHSTTSSNEQMNKSFKTEKCEDPTQLDVTAPELIAQALLNIPDKEIGPALRQQITSMRSNSSTDGTPKNDGKYQQVNGHCNVQNHTNMNYQQHLQINQGSHSQALSHEDQNRDVSSYSEQIQQHVTRAQSSDLEASPPQTTQLTFQMDTSNSSQITHKYKSTKYVQKQGHHFILGELPNGKYRVYEIKGNKVEDTQIEMSLKDRHTSQSANSTASPSTQVVPEDTQAMDVATSQDSSSHAPGTAMTQNTRAPGTAMTQNTRAPVETDYGSPGPSLALALPDKNLSGNLSSLPSVNLTSLSFDDLNRDDVFAKKPRGKKSS